MFTKPKPIEPVHIAFITNILFSALEKYANLKWGSIVWHDFAQQPLNSYMQTQIVGIVASVLSAVSMLPQLIKLIKEKDAENVSIAMILVLLAGLGLWAYYGFLIKDPIIIISNSFSVCINLALLFFTLRYKK